MYTCLYDRSETSAEPAIGYQPVTVQVLARSSAGRISQLSTIRWTLIQGAGTDRLCAGSPAAVDKTSQFLEQVRQAVYFVKDDQLIAVLA